MDYSQIHHDPEHPAGPSPWVTSPPTSSQTSFGASSTLQSGESSPVATSTYAERRTQPSDSDSGDETFVYRGNGSEA